MNYCRFLGLLAAASLAYAGPITYAFSGTINGSVGGVAFTNAPFTLAQTSDTNLITESSFYAYTPLFQNGASITIGGFGTGTISTDTYVFSEFFSGFNYLGFFSLSGGYVYGFDFPFETYDLQSAIGPIRTTSAFVSDLALSSTLGDIILQGDNPGFGSIPDLTFTATGGVPEPGTTSLLLGLGALLLFAARRHS